MPQAKELQSQKELLVDDIRRFMNMLMMDVLDSSVTPKHFTGVAKRIMAELRALHQQVRETERRHAQENTKRWKRLMGRYAKRTKLSASRKSKREL